MSVGEAPVKRAITWIDEQLQRDPAGSRGGLIDEASRRFSVSPFLYRHLATAST